MLKGRAGSQGKNEFPCAVAECSKKTSRRGGYCADHHNAYKVGDASKIDKCLHVCAGVVKNGTCERHRNHGPSIYVPSPVQKAVSRRRKGKKPRRASEVSVDQLSNGSLASAASLGSASLGALTKDRLESVSEDEDGLDELGGRSESREKGRATPPAASSAGARSSLFAAASAAATAETTTDRKRVPVERKRGDSAERLGGGEASTAGKPRRRSILQLASQPEKQEELVQTFLDAIYSISREIEPDKAAAQIINQTCRLLKAERTTLFYVDGDELILMIAKGARNIRLPKSKGVVGHVATTGEAFLVPDAYAEPKFDSSFDKQSGFRTRNILALPIKDDHNATIAVLQIINKEVGEFSENDKVLAENIAAHCSVVLRNAQLYETAIRAEQKVTSLVELVTMLHSDPTPSSLTFTLTHQNVVEADRCSLYICDDARGELVVMQGDVDIRFPMDKGIAGYVAINGKSVNIPDCYKDPRFNQDVDKKTGFRTRTMLCMPIFSGRKVIGVLQLINKKDDTQFNEADQRILTTLLNIAGPVLQRSPLFAAKKRVGAQQQIDTRSDMALPRARVVGDSDFKSLAEEYEEADD